VAYGVLRHSADAEDVAQEALLKAYRNFSRLRESARFRGWLVRIAFRMALDRWRSVKRREKREAGWTGAEQRASGPTAEEVAVSSEFQARLERAMAELPEKFRLVLLLAGIQGYTLEEVSGMLGIPMGTVKSRLFFCEEAVGGEATMKCEGYRDKLIAALASGESSPADDVAAHLRTCAECKKFYEAHVHLFGAIDSGVRAMVNEAVPASLLSEVRERMEEVQAARANWKLSWSVAGLAAAVVLVAVGFMARRGPRPTAVPLETVASARPTSEKITRVLAPEKAVHPVVRWSHRTRGEPFSNPESVTSSPEVLVPAEERAGYEQYIRTIRVGNKALAKDANFTDPIEIAPQEIAQLQIKKLELTSITEETQE
jgi:RNA polymerase sigma-70 factor (ECF subfamily)